MLAGKPCPNQGHYSRSRALLTQRHCFHPTEAIIVDQWMRVWASLVAFPKNAPPADHHWPSELTHRIGEVLGGLDGQCCSQWVWADTISSKNGILTGNSKQHPIWLQTNKRNQIAQGTRPQQTSGNRECLHMLATSQERPDAAGKIWIASILLTITLQMIVATRMWTAWKIKQYTTLQSFPSHTGTSSHISTSLE